MKYYVNGLNSTKDMFRFLFLGNHEPQFIMSQCDANDISSTCHERTPSGPGKSVHTLQVAAHHRDGWAGGGRQI